MLLEAKDLSVKHRHGALAVNRLSFSLDKGQTLTVLGDTESGKTSLLKAIAGLYKISDGELFLHGKIANDMPISDRNTRLLHEDGGFFTHRSALYNLTYPLKVRRADTTVDPVFIKADLLKKKVFRLTVEEKTALMMERLNLPFGEIFLLDDPFKPFPKEKRKDMFLFYLPFIRSLADRGALIYATSSYFEAETLDAPTLLIHYGNEQQFGIVSDFATRPNSLCALYYSSADYSSGIARIEFSNGETVAECDNGEMYPLDKKYLLNEIYIGKEVIYAKTSEDIFFFDKKCEQRIYFPEQ